MSMGKWKSWKCRCRVDVGQLHKLGCEYEVCPFCGWQLIACECRYKKLGVDCSPGAWAYVHGLTKKQDAQFEKILTKKGRIPYILIPNQCALCGEQWPKDFRVSNHQWEKFVIPPLQKEMLCLECYQELKSIFPKGWKRVAGNGDIDG